jgi:hypothetical protein
VLLEWWLAVELHARYGTKVMPLLIGSQITDDKGVANMANSFAEKPPKLRADGRGNEVEMGLTVKDNRTLVQRVADVHVAPPSTTGLTNSSRTSSCHGAF